MRLRIHILIVACSTLLIPSLPAATTHIVQIRDFYFTPTNLTVAVGDTVLWTNAVTLNHDSGSTNAAFPWNSGNLAGNATYSLTFTNPGVFGYVCNRHFFSPVNPRREQTGTVAVVSANLPPTVSLLNPPNNAKFRAPAEFTLQATAAAPGGSVTNVQFFAGEAICGSANLAPYSVVFTNAIAGNYLFTARAYDNLGATATSAPITVFVLTNATLGAPVQPPGSPPQFTVFGLAGQTYTLEASTNLTTWTPFITNVAPANAFAVTDATGTNEGPRFYRARQDY